VYASNPQAHWWTDLLRGNLLLSLVYANPLVPALGLAFGCLLALSRFDETGSRGHLALAALQAAAVPLFKVFLGAQLLLGLGVAFLLARGSAAVAPRSIAVAAPARLVTALLALGQGGETVGRRVSRRSTSSRSLARRWDSRLPRTSRSSEPRCCGCSCSLGLRASACRTRCGALRGLRPSAALAAMALWAGRSGCCCASPLRRSSRARRS
jgi:hypothetical protein